MHRVFRPPMSRTRAEQLIRTPLQSVNAHVQCASFVCVQRMAHPMRLRRRTVALEPGRDRSHVISSLTSSAGGCPAVLRAPRWRRYESGSTQGLDVCVRVLSWTSAHPDDEPGFSRAGGAASGADCAARPSRHAAAERVDRLGGVPVAQAGAATGHPDGADRPPGQDRRAGRAGAARAGQDGRFKPTATTYVAFQSAAGRCSRRPTRTRRCW